MRNTYECKNNIFLVIIDLLLHVYVFIINTIEEIFMKGLKFLLSILAFTLILASCSSKNTDLVEETSKILRVAVPGDILSLDSTLATDDFSLEVISAFTEGLVIYDANNNEIPAIATDWTISKDGTEYVFNLDPNARWSNGDAVTANDFVFAWRRLANPTTKAEYSIMLQTAHIKNATEVITGEISTDQLGVEAIDATTLKVTLDIPVPYFLKLMTLPSFFPLNEAFVLEQGSAYATSPETLLSNAPFILTSWVQGSLLFASKNEAYIGAVDVAIDGIEWRVIFDAQTLSLEYEQGNLDVVAMTDDLQETFLGTADFTQILKGYVWYLPFNLKSDNPAMTNENFRLAIAWSFDRSFFINDILNDGSVVAAGFVPFKLSSGPTGKDFRDDAPVYFGYDIAKASAYWESAKVELGTDTVAFNLLVNDSENTDLALEAPEYFKSEVEKNLSGVTVNIISTTQKDRLDRMKLGDYEVGMTRWRPDYADPLAYLFDLLYSGNTWNFSAYASDEYDALVTRSMPGGELATDLEARWEALIAAEKMALDAAVVIPMWQSGGKMIIKPNISGIEYHIIGMTDYRHTEIE